MSSMFFPSVQPSSARRAFSGVQGRRNVIGPDVHQADAPDGCAAELSPSELAAGGESGGHERPAAHGDVPPTCALRSGSTGIDVPSSPRGRRQPIATRRCHIRLARCARRQPCPPAASRGGAAHASRVLAPARVSARRARSSGAPVRELADADRLLEVAGEPGVEEPARRARAAARSARRPGSAPSARPASSRAASVPSMSGSRRSIRITSGRCSAASAIPSAPRRRLERPEPGGAQHVARELQVLLVVVDDQDERGLLRLEAETSPAYPPRMPIRLVLAEDHYLVREGVRRLLETQPDLEVAAVCGDLDSLLAAVDAEQPDVVVTDIRMPPGEHRRGDPGRRAAARDEPGGRRRRAQPVREPELRARAPGGRQRSGAPTS